MSEPAHFPLDWRVFRLSGPDRKEFLHGLVTNDVKGMAPGRDLWCCLLTPKGRLQAHFWVYDEPEGLALVCPSESAENARAALAKMVMLSESALSEPPEKVFWTSVPGPRPCAALGGWFSPAPAGRALGACEFERLRIERGVPRFGVDADAETIPLEARLEPAISYAKGCYMGQETISRIHHMGHVNRLLARLKFEGPAPAPGAPVLKDGAEVGKITSAAGDLALAMVKREVAAPGTALSAGPSHARVL
jgi:folate-binding protein YgfZ